MRRAGEQSTLEDENNAICNCVYGYSFDSYIRPRKWIAQLNDRTVILVVYWAIGSYVVTLISKQCRNSKEQRFYWPNRATLELTWLKLIRNGGAEWRNREITS
jgi:uncharacterized DUF497 family protein